MKFGVFVVLFLIGVILIGVVAQFWTTLANEFDIGSTDNTIIPVDYEGVITGEDTSFQFHLTSDNVAYQTFQATSTHNLVSVKLKGWLSGASGSSVLHASIYATDNAYEPIGGALCTGSESLTSFSTSHPGQWTTVDMTTHITVTSGTYYDIVVWYIGSGSFVWDTQAPDSSGFFGYSTDAGENWSDSVPCNEFTITVLQYGFWELLNPDQSTFTVSSGESQAISFTTGHMGGIKVDGVSYRTSGTYSWGTISYSEIEMCRQTGTITFTNVSKNHTIDLVGDVCM